MPFLDVRLIERVMSLRANNPDHQMGQKAWLRMALKGIVPDEVLTRPKAGFQPPVKEWLLGVVAKYSSILKYGQLVKSEILAAEKIEYICSELPHTNYAGLFFAYKLVLLEFWYQEVVAA
jgi:asparagine synthase (glutamine-hydrolysing)